MAQALSDSHVHDDNNMTVFVLMGTAGCGKSTVAKELQKLLNCEFMEGDDFHPPANVKKMSEGHPLTDDDRWPWLRSIQEHLIERGKQAKEDHSHRHVTIVTCSALRRVYRDILRQVPSNLGTVWFVFLKGSTKLLTERIAARRGHYMAASMLQSQLDVLEEPNPEQEQVIVADIAPPPDQIAQQILQEGKKQHILP
ncbi:shikimate kinase [Radiomyces spectabilis]|uniref:shikimate kinase n=1 Tax=Radiomyces spectabilis TaxID=64574 RepID=UPI00221EC545|nr:shikimate kinase [Radiomyces spectabilis]KAI8384864.1 shikimate kinase [Radiomyces spectabilis]